MKTSCEFHLLKYTSAPVVYHTSSRSLLKIPDVYADPIKMGEAIYDPFMKNVSGKIKLPDYDKACSCLSNKIGYDKLTENRSKINKCTDILSKMVLVVSHGCNMKCTYCFLDKLNREERYMTPETACLAIKVFLSNYPGRLRNVLFFGGEPLLNWRTIQAVVNLPRNIVNKKVLLFPALQFRPMAHCLIIVRLLISRNITF
jgi:L-lysine 2,3-aminomutase